MVRLLKHLLLVEIKLHLVVREKAQEVVKKLKVQRMAMMLHHLMTNQILELVQNFEDNMVKLICIMIVQGKNLPTPQVLLRKVIPRVCHHKSHH
jgi:hypothetical protein